MNLILHALKKRFTFESAKGNILISDVCILPVTQLREMANKLNNEVNKSHDLFAIKDASHKEKSLKLSIILEIIADRDADALKASKRTELLAKNQELKELVATKRAEKTSKQSLSALEAQLANSEAELSEL